MVEHGMEVCTESNEDLAPTDNSYDLLESRTFYPVALPICAPITQRRSSAAVLVHYVRNQPDRVTFCGWFIRKAMVAEERGKEWNTDISVNGLRNLATTYIRDTGDFDIGLWRNARLIMIPRSIDLPDIDVSVGFDTFLTSVVGQDSPDHRYVRETNFSSAIARTHLCRWLERIDRRCQPREYRHPSSSSKQYVLHSEPHETLLAF